jgi:signal transduction histidine kinase
MRYRTFAVVAIGTVGVLGSVALAWQAGMPTSDTAVLIAVSAVGAAVASALGWLALRVVRNRSLATQVVLIAVSSTIATIVGVVAAAQAMFISAHDVHVLLVVAMISGAVAVGAALQFSRSVAVGTRQVGDLVRRVGDGEAVGSDLPPVPREMAALADRLAEVSERLAASRRHELALERSRRELIAWVSHDLRAPLATIRAVTEALDDGVVDDPETVARYHHQIRVDAERLTRLVDDLFELSRITSGLTCRDRHPIGLGDLVGDVVGEARSLAEMNGVNLVDEIGDSLPTLAVSDQELRRALHNLIDNAIRHTPAGGTVVVASAADQRGPYLSVVDECGGIPAPDLDRVFDVAFRGDAARVRDERGGGLGLAIAKGLVEAHDGSIEVANQSYGCCFTVRLPTAAAPPEPSEPAGASTG